MALNKAQSKYINKKHKAKLKITINELITVEYVTIIIKTISKKG